MQKYILDGDPKEVAKVIQENRIRVERGVISFAPVQPETAFTDPDAISALRENADLIEAQNVRLTAENQELTRRVAELEQSLISVTNVPENTETVLNDTENTENAGEIVPETVPNDSDPVEDNKNIEVEDMTEVNLDDVKDAPEVDTKEAPAPTPKKTRTKKTE